MKKTIDLISLQLAGCPLCIYYNGSGTCEAYPTGIPVPFSSGEVLHDDPAAGDGGKQFTPPETAFLVEIDM